MPDRGFDAVFYVREPARIRFEDGLFHISFQVGKDAVVELVMLPSTYFASRRAAVSAANRFDESGDVVGIRKAQH